jgi:tetratricopeptide (TPR) repeat protein
LERVYVAGGTGRADDDLSDDLAVKRLFELLAETKRQDRLVELAGRTSPFQLTLINFLVERGDEELARRAVANTGYEPAWINARTGQMGLYFKNPSPAVENAFKQSLGAFTIGDLVDTPYDAEQRLLDTDYFITARNYGMWLDLVAGRKEDARSYIVGRIEDRPRDGSAHSQLVRYYLASGDVAAASRHSELATVLSPDDRDVIAARGAVFYASNERQKARDAWRTLLTASDADSASYQLYFRELSSRGLVREALEDLRPIIARRTTLGQFGEVSDLVDDMASYGKEHRESVGAIADSLYGAAIDAPQDFQSAAAVLVEDILPDDRKSQFFRLITVMLDGL